MEKVVEKKEYGFMEHFVLIGSAEREKIREYWGKVVAYCGLERFFKSELRHALERVNYDFRFAAIKPSVSVTGEIFYDSLGIPQILTPRAWDEKAKAFAPEYGSRLATPDEAILWWAYLYGCVDIGSQYACILKDVSGRLFWCDRYKQFRDTERPWRTISMEDRLQFAIPDIWSIANSEQKKMGYSGLLVLTKDPAE